MARNLDAQEPLALCFPLLACHIAYQSLSSGLELRGAPPQQSILVCLPRSSKQSLRLAPLLRLSVQVSHEVGK